MHRQLGRTGDPALVDLLTEVEGYLPHEEHRRDDRSPASDAVVPLRLTTPQGELAPAAALGVVRRTAPTGP